MEYTLLPKDNDARSALIVVDMQNFFFRKAERRRHLDGVIVQINRLIQYFDARVLPVIHTITAYQPDGSDWDLKMKAAGVPELIAGSQEAAILPGILALDTHRTITKTRYSAFFKTSLATVLHADNIRRAIVVGAYTHYCVNATVFDAYCHNFIPGLITDAVISHLPEESALMIERMRRNGYHLFTTDEFISMYRA